MNKRCHHEDFEHVRSVVQAKFWLQVSGTLCGLWSRTEINAWKWKEQWVIKDHTYPQVDWAENFIFSLILNWNTLAHSRWNASWKQWRSGFVCSPVLAGEQFTWKLWQPRTRKVLVVWMPSINLFPDEVIRKQVCQARVLCSWEQLDSSVGCLPF